MTVKGQSIYVCSSMIDLSKTNATLKYAFANQRKLIAL
jgi:hypothetical protein